DREYQYDIQGSLVRTQDRQRGAFLYRYSELEAILEARSDTGEYDERYEYDANENLTLTREGLQASYGRGNRLRRAGGRTYEHNPSGGIPKIVENGRESVLAYNPEGQLSSARTPDGRNIEYRYDPLGRRIRKTVDGETTRYFWDQGAHLGEVLPSNEPIDYLFLPETLLPLGMTAAGEHYSFVLDQAGTPMEIVDRNVEIAGSGLC